MRLFRQFCLAAVLSTMPSLSVTAFATLPLSIETRQSSASLLSSSFDEVERLKQSASKLREEAEALRKNLDDSPRKYKAESSTTASPPLPVAYTSMNDSCWALTYRYSNEPINENEQKEMPPRINYSGTLTVKFRSDGYTDLISHEPSSLGSPTLDIDKVWGWDEETSNEDDKQYILFSVNTSSGDRYYWQARIDVNGQEELSLTEGTVTVKKDVEPPGGFWGVFNGGGILAQFRFVGNFGGKPVRE